VLLGPLPEFFEAVGIRLVSGDELFQREVEAGRLRELVTKQMHLP
jgi:hypothetical protein